MIITECEVGAIVTDHPPLLDSQGNLINNGVRQNVKMEILFEGQAEFDTFLSRVDLRVGSVINVNTFGQTPSDQRKDIVIKQLEQELVEKKKEIQWFEGTTGKRIKKPLDKEEITNLTYVQI